MSGLVGLFLHSIIAIHFLSVLAQLCFSIFVAGGIFNHFPKMKHEPGICSIKKISHNFTNCRYERKIIDNNLAVDVKVIFYSLYTKEIIPGKHVLWLIKFFMAFSLKALLCSLILTATFYTNTWSNNIIWTLRTMHEPATKIRLPALEK